MNAPEPPLERLNYFNGQRLEAGDLRLEQEFHIRVRRWLNKTLYLPGIASGLEVTVKTGDLHRVVVSSGLAIDYEGREIILLEPREVVAVGVPSTTVGVVYGNYLVIAYEETKTAPVEDGCAVRRNGNGVRSDLAWGAPSRIRCEPRVQFKDTWPGVTTGEIPLCQVELDGNCTVREIHTSIRKYVAASKPPVVRPLSLEGEKDIDKNNPKVLRFHVDGATAAFATLYLRATLFSTLFYTEVGKHAHGLDIQLENLNIVDHSHGLGALTTDSGDLPDHDHSPIEANTANCGDAGHDAIELAGVDSGCDDMNLNRRVSLTVNSESGGHTHTIATGETTEPGGGVVDLALTLTNATAESFGVTDVPARGGDIARTYVSGLIITFDDTQDITTQVLAQLQGRDGAAAWAALGDGTPSHLMVTRGTEDIDLIQAGANLAPGPHSLTFSVLADGGQIQYNLYVG